MNALLAVLTSPVVIVGAILLTTTTCLTINQSHSRTMLENLVQKTMSLTKSQDQLVSVHQNLLETSQKLAAEVKFHGNRLKTIEKGSRENNLIIYDIPEKDEENTESLVRQMLSKNFELRFGEYEIENVRRFGKRTAFVVNGENGEGRKIKVRFFHYRDKLKVLSRLTDLYKLTIKDDSAD